MTLLTLQDLFRVGDTALVLDTTQPSLSASKLIYAQLLRLLVMGNKCCMGEASNTMRYVGGLGTWVLTCIAGSYDDFMGKGG